jgi:Protein of unknown function (DUF1822)
MKTKNRDILLENLRQIYSEHELIDVEDSAIEFNFQCLAPVKQWIEETLGFPCEYTFPYLDSTDKAQGISELVNGFCLKVNGHKIIFIPSQNLDITACEIPQEWVDLPNWRGEYYVPIQIDVEAKYLHLWGMITADRVMESASLDSLFHYYQVDGDRMIHNLEVLWASCELAPTTQGEQISTLVTLSATQAQTSIDRLLATASPNFPRLILPFSEWGAILNHPDYLERYLTTAHRSNFIASQLTNLSDWFEKQAENISHYWETIEHFINPPQPRSVFRGSCNNLRHVLCWKKYQDIPLETPEQINTAIEQLYRSQTEISIPDRLTGIDDLVPLIETPTNENIRWKATEYLWIIDPYHPKLPTRWIRDLGIQFSTDSLALMISQVAINNQRRAILLRIYPMNQETYLPAGVKLAVFDGEGKPILNISGKPFEAISRQKPQDNYIQLFFVADKHDRFSIGVSLDTQYFTEHFIV